MPDEIEGVKFSEFSSETPDNADEVVGLHSGNNARFSVANFVLAVRQGLANLFVPVTRKVNNKALSADIALNASDVGAVGTSAVGAADGVAGLDSNGKVPTSQLPTMPSDVEANPAGTATDTLTKLKVDNTIYSVSGGADEATIAPVEASTTAAEAHPLGSIFYLNGVLYRALSDIAVGGTINTAAGGNATQTTIAENFSRTVKLTSAQYAQLSAAEKAADIVYIIKDNNAIAAEDVSYDNTDSGASATTAQEAIDELFEEKANQSQLAYVETGTTASRAYAAGEYFCWNGLLYRVKLAIQSGEPFTVGTNCEQKTVTTMPGAVLLWTNLNQASSFSAQTIGVDLSRFTRVHMVCKLDAGDSGVFDTDIVIDSSTHVISRITIPGTNSASIGVSRSFSFNTSGIVVGDGLKKTLLNGTRETANVKVVPIRIYGIY